ncbi:hypothetical protein FRC07_002292 [Ceratobasidium sp. 392]|nr:hypothetical protein FRC07_002292 [Ceratobasidium sp. 392]
MAAAVETPVAITADATNGSESEEQRALKQFEFYFDDANLPYDKFMWKLHTQTPEHWVPISTVASFKRMREFQPKGTDWLLNVLKQSDGLIEIDESGTNVRRARELLPPKDQFDRSVYAKGFPDESPDLQIRLEQFFAQFGKVNAVRMPYCTMKIKEKGLDKKGVTPRTHSGSGGAGGRRQFDAFQLKDGVIPEDNKKKKPDVTVTFHGKTYVVDSRGEVDVAVESFEYEKGSAVKFSGAGSEEAKFGEIKTPLKERFTPLPFIRMDKGASEGTFGFGKTLSDEDLAFIREKVPQIAGGKMTKSAHSTFGVCKTKPNALSQTPTPQLETKSSPGEDAVDEADGWRGGRGGRGGGRDNNANKRDSKPKSIKSEPKDDGAEPVEALKAGKTQGEIEPSGEGAGQGVRGTGAGVPSIAVGKRKAEEEGAGGEEKKIKTE